MIVQGDKTKEATRVILGGEWFRETQTGEENVYLMADFKSKVFDPIVQRIAKHVYENGASLDKLACFGGGILAWVVVVTVGIGYRYLKGRKGGARDPEVRPLQKIRQI